RPDPGRRARYSLLAPKPAQPRQAGSERGGRIDAHRGHRRTAERADSARTIVDPHQFPSARGDRAPVAAGSKRTDPGRARAEEYRPGDWACGAYSAIDRQEFGDGRIPLRPRDHEASPLSAIRAASVQGGRAGLDRGAGDRSTPAGHWLRLYRVFQRREVRVARTDKGSQIPREAGHGDRQALRQSRPLSLERRYVFLADGRTAGRSAPSPAQNRDYSILAAGFCRPWLLPEAEAGFSALRKHLHRLRRSRTRP